MWWIERGTTPSLYLQSWLHPPPQIPGTETVWPSLLLFLISVSGIELAYAVDEMGTEPNKTPANSVGLLQNSSFFTERPRVQKLEKARTTFKLVIIINERTDCQEIYRLKEDQAFSLSLELGRREKVAWHPSAEFLLPSVGGGWRFCRYCYCGENDLERDERCNWFCEYSILKNNFLYISFQISIHSAF